MLSLKHGQGGNKKQKEKAMDRNTDGNLTIETTMKKVRRYPTWQDELDTSDEEAVIVCEDGSVSCKGSGDIICEADSFCSEFDPEWLEYWGFQQDSDELNGRR